jgi:ferredoxin
MVNEKVILRIPADMVDRPIICQMSRQYDVIFNILKAEVTEEEDGLLILGLTGRRQQVAEAIDYIRAQGITVERLGGRTSVHKNLCTHCGACVAHCPTEALVLDEARYVHFVPAKCIACGLCLPTCPYNAIEMAYAEVA